VKNTFAYRIEFGAHFLDFSVESMQCVFIGVACPKKYVGILYIGAHFMIVKKSYTNLGRIDLEMRLRILLKVFVVLLNMLHENASFSQISLFFVVTVRSMWSFYVRNLVAQTNGIKTACF
jgi:hypothetical protein